MSDGITVREIIETYGSARSTATYRIRDLEPIGGSGCGPDPFLYDRQAVEILLQDKKTRMAQQHDALVIWWEGRTHGMQALISNVHELNGIEYAEARLANGDRCKVKRPLKYRYTWDRVTT